MAYFTRFYCHGLAVFPGWQGTQYPNKVVFLVRFSSWHPRAESGWLPARLIELHLAVHYITIFPSGKSVHHQGSVILFPDLRGCVQTQCGSPAESGYLVTADSVSSRKLCKSHIAEAELPCTVISEAWTQMRVAALRIQQEPLHSGSV